MKAWYDDIDSATLQRIRIYSAFNDAKSKNLMMQTMYEYREKEIQDFKETNHELAEICIERKKRIVELEKENNKLTERLGDATEIIELMKDLFFDCWQERGYKAIKFEQRVNDFLKEKEKL